MTQLLYHGHGSLALSSNHHRIIEIDPYAGKDYIWDADLILVSHHHYDHDKVDLVKHKKDCQVVDPTILHANGEYLSTKLDDILIQAVPAANDHHARDIGMGFIIQIDGIKIYISGDTSWLPEMKSWKEQKIDYAFLCCDGIYNMDLDEATQCKNEIGAKHTFVYHTSPEKLFDVDKIPAFVAAGFEYVLPGEMIELTK